MKNYSNSKLNQRGATLIVSLVILAVITVLGIASIRSSNLELKMAASARDKATARKMAEAGIQAVEQLIGEARYGLPNFLADCAEAQCFTRNCDETGLCFSGTFRKESSDAGQAPSALHKYECKLGGEGDAVSAQFNTQEKWRDKAYWEGSVDTPSTAPTVDVLVNAKDDSVRIMPVSYMIEFMCFAPKSEHLVGTSDSDVPLYRITTRADGPAGRSTVMLQSVFVAGF